MREWHLTLNNTTKRTMGNEMKSSSVDNYYHNLKLDMIAVVSDYNINNDLKIELKHLMAVLDHVYNGYNNTPNKYTSDDQMMKDLQDLEQEFAETIFYYQTEVNNDNA
jgi:hypothetical protein